MITLIDWLLLIARYAPVLVFIEFLWSFIFWEMILFVIYIFIKSGFRFLRCRIAEAAFGRTGKGNRLQKAGRRRPRRRIGFRGSRPLDAVWPPADQSRPDLASHEFTRNKGRTEAEPRRVTCEQGSRRADCQAGRQARNPLGNHRQRHSEHRKRFRALSRVEKRKVVRRWSLLLTVANSLSCLKFSGGKLFLMALPSDFCRYLLSWLLANRERERESSEVWIMYLCDIVMSYVQFMIILYYCRSTGTNAYLIILSDVLLKWNCFLSLKSNACFCCSLHEIGFVCVHVFHYRHSNFTRHSVRPAHHRSTGHSHVNGRWVETQC